MGEKTKGLNWLGNIKWIRKWFDDLKWFDRVAIYIFFIVAGWAAAHWGTEYIVKWLSGRYQTQTEATPIIDPSTPVAIFLFGFVLSIGAWIIRTSDTIKQFKDSLQVRNDSLQVRNDSLQVRNDTLFIEAVRLLFEGGAVQSRAQGLLQLVDLEKSGAIDEEQLIQITGAGIDLKKANFVGVQLEGIHLWNAHLENANLKGANLKGTYLCDAYLEGAELENAELEDADLMGAHLMGANLRYADLSGADLSHVNFEGANLEGAMYNKDTKFPDNFNPTDSKMVKTD